MLKLNNRVLSIAISSELKELLPEMQRYYLKDSISDLVRYCLEEAYKFMIENKTELIPPSKTEVLPEVIVPVLTEVIPQEAARDNMNTYIQKKRQEVEDNEAEVTAQIEEQIMAEIGD